MNELMEADMALRALPATNEERETVILGNAGSREWNFWTLDPKFARRLKKLGYELKADRQGGYSCVLPLNAITLRRKSALGKRKGGFRSRPKGVL